nr:uncharacterized protein LOC113824813 [Penaeus vannamei]
MRDKKWVCLDSGAGQIAQVHWGPPLQVLGVSVSVTLYLLLTSLQPLRAHVHAHGEVVFRQPPSRGYAKIPGRVWTWAELISWVGRTSGQEAMRAMVGHTEAALATVALVADLLLPPKLQSLRKTVSEVQMRRLLPTAVSGAGIQHDLPPGRHFHQRTTRPVPPRPELPRPRPRGRGGGRGQVAKTCWHS